MNRTIICSDFRVRPLRSRKKRILRKIGMRNIRREWMMLTEEEWYERGMRYLEMMYSCDECGLGLGENHKCQTCRDSWPELTPEQKERMDCFQPNFIENLFQQVEMTAEEAEEAYDAAEPIPMSREEIDSIVNRVTGRKR